MALLGAALIACAIAADRRWFDRHFMPTFFASRRVYVVALCLARIVLAVVGVAVVLFARPRIGRLVARTPAGTLVADAARIVLATALALVAGELVLRRTVFGLAAEEQPADQEPLRRRNERIGWVFVPARTGRARAGGRVIDYTFDSAGYRVRSASQPVDPARPSILFAGESIMVGHGLTWDESVPAQVHELLATQSANLAVHGFGTDQAYLRLVSELPRFSRPKAVVLLFTPALFDRNLDEDRPHLGPGLVWLPPRRRWSLVALANWLVPYRSDEAIERGISVTSAILRATVDLARGRGAVALIVMPQFMPEEPTERVLRRSILDETELPYLRIELDRAWRIAGDLHPDARAARVIALAVAARLRGEIR